MIMAPKSHIHFLNPQFFSFPKMSVAFFVALSSQKLFRSKSKPNYVFFIDMGHLVYQVGRGLPVEAVDLDVAGPELAGGRGQRRRGGRCAIILLTSAGKEKITH